MTSSDAFQLALAPESSDASQLGAAPERRFARDGLPYTRHVFLEWYGVAGERNWADAVRELADAADLADARTDGATTRDAAEVADGRTDDATRELADVPQLDDGRIDGATTGDAAQLPAGAGHDLALIATLMPEHVIAIQQAEAARGPPRGLHKLARGAINIIFKRPNRETVNLDDYFPWVQYVAAHRQSAEIIGPGITHAHAMFFSGTNDYNRGGAQRLDFCFFRTDGTVCRVHPGYRRSEDAALVFYQPQ